MNKVVGSLSSLGPAQTVYGDRGPNFQAWNAQPHLKSSVRPSQTSTRAPVHKAARHSDIAHCGGPRAETCHTLVIAPHVHALGSCCAVVVEFGQETASRIQRCPRMYCHARVRLPVVRKVVHTVDVSIEYYNSISTQHLVAFPAPRSCHSDAVHRRLDGWQTPGAWNSASSLRFRLASSYCLLYSIGLSAFATVGCVLRLLCCCAQLIPPKPKPVQR